MTYPRDYIVFNTSTGSDTAASGLGPSTAVTGTTAAHTNGVGSTTITLTNSPDLSGVVAGDLLYLATSSGRKFSVIASVDDGADTVTVDDSFNIASGSAVDYAIGGKRNSWDTTNSRLMFTADKKAGWKIKTETNQTITTGINLGSTSGDANNPIVICGVDATTVLTVGSGNFTSFDTSGSHIIFENFKAVKVTSGPGVGFRFAGNNSTGNVIRNMILDGGNLWSYCLSTTGNAAYYGLLIENCEICNATTGLLLTGLSGRSGEVRNCEIYGCTTGISNQDNNLHIADCIIRGNSGVGISTNTSSSSVYALTIDRCTIHGNTSDGIRFASANACNLTTVQNCNITANGGYGINLNSGTFPYASIIRYCNFGTGGLANASGSANGITLDGTNLTVDPGYANAASRDFSVGTNVKAAGYPPSDTALGYDQSATYSYVDIGAAQRQEAGAAPTLLGQASF